MSNMTRGRFFYGWVIVAVAALGLMAGVFPVVVISFGVFARAYLREFHADRAAISLAFTLHNLISGLCVFFVGRLADRIGPRKLIVPSIAILAVILLSALAIGSGLWQLYVFYGVLGVFGGASSSAVYGLVICRWFNRWRGLALSLMTIGLGAGSVCVPYLAQQLIAGLGWRAAFAVFGGAMLLVPLPIVGKFLADSPQDIGLLPDGEDTDSIGPADAPEGLTWGEIWHSRIFWPMVAAFVLISAGIQGCTVHMAEIFSDRGASANAAALATSVAGLGLMVGRVGVGYFLDRYFAPAVARLIFASAAMGMVLLWADGSGVQAWTGAFLVALAMGAEVDIIGYLMSRYFGLRSLGAAFCFAFGAFVLAGGVGPLIMGFGFDRTGSYRIPLAGFFAGAALAVLLLGRLGPYRYAVTQKRQSAEVTG
jgi:MFS family permease